MYSLNLSSEDFPRGVRVVWIGDDGLEHQNTFAYDDKFTFLAFMHDAVMDGFKMSIDYFG